MCQVCIEITQELVKETKDLILIREIMRCYIYFCLSYEVLMTRIKLVITRFKHALE